MTLAIAWLVPACTFFGIGVLFALLSALWFRRRHLHNNLYAKPFDVGPVSTYSYHYAEMMAILDPYCKSRELQKHTHNKAEADKRNFLINDYRRRWNYLFGLTPVLVSLFITSYILFCYALSLYLDLGTVQRVDAIIATYGTWIAYSIVYPVLTVTIFYMMGSSHLLFYGLGTFFVTASLGLGCIASSQWMLLGMGAFLYLVCVGFGTLQLQSMPLFVSLKTEKIRITRELRVAFGVLCLGLGLSIVWLALGPEYSNILSDANTYQLATSMFAALLVFIPLLMAGNEFELIKRNCILDAYDTQLTHATKVRLVAHYPYKPQNDYSV